MVFMIVISILNAFERVPIYSSQYLEYDGNGITLPNGDFLFFTNASTNNGLNVMMNRVCVNGTNVNSEPYNITNAPGDESIIQQVLSSDNCLIFIYNYINPLVSYDDSEIYIQKVTLNGELLWGERGIRLGIPSYNRFKLVPNNNGGAYVTYVLVRNYPKLYGWNFDAQGNNQWHSEFVFELQPPNLFYLSNVVSDGDGNIIVNLWVQPDSNSYLYSYLVKISPQGNTIGNSPMVTQSQFSGCYDIFSAQNGNYFLWKSNLSSITFQKMDASGNLLFPEPISYQYDENVSEISTFGSSADGGLYYYLNREYPLYPMLCKLNADLQPSWSAPIELPFYWNYYNGTYRIMDDNSIYIAYVDYINSYYPIYDSGIMLTHIDPINGTYSFPATYISNMVFPKYGVHIFNSSANALVSWSDLTDGNFEVRCQIVDPSGSILLQTEGETLQYRHFGSVEKYQAVEILEGSCYVFEINNIDLSSKLYYQICNDNLSPLLEEFGRELNPDSDEIELLKAIVRTLDNQIGILYLSGNEYFNLYYQVIDNMGIALLPGKGVLIKENVANTNCNFCMTCADGDVIIAWEEVYSLLYTQIIRGQCLHNNVPQWVSGGKILKQSTPKGVALIKILGNYLVFADYALDYSLGVIKLDANGNPEPSWALTGSYITSGTNLDLIQNCGLINDELVLFYYNQVSPDINNVHNLCVQKYNNLGYGLWGDYGIILDTSGSWGIASIEGASYGQKVFFSMLKYNVEHNRYEIHYNVINDDGTMLWENTESIPIQYIYQSSTLHHLSYNNDVNSLFWLSRTDNYLKEIKHHYILPDGLLYYNEPVLIEQIAKAITNLMSLNKETYGLATYIINDYYFEDKKFREENEGLPTFGNNPKGISYSLNSLYACKISSNPTLAEDPIQNPSNLFCHNYPNPFNPETTICFDLPAPDRIHLNIYNLKGQLIRNLINDYKPSGKQSVIWNGTDNNNQSVASGVYVYKITTGKYIQTGKMMLMK